MDERVLYQFPISHYCEKTRWQLTCKGLAFTASNLLPGPHRLRSQWMARINTLPILRDGERVVGDSTKIAYYLEKYYPSLPLLPTEAEARGALRLSLGHTSTDADVDAVLAALPGVVERARRAGGLL